MPLALTDPRLIVSWSDLRSRGVSPDRIRAQLDAHRWRRWGRAIALHNGPLSVQQRWYVARVHGGPQAMLTAFTTAEALGLRGWHRDEVHVLLPRGARASERCPVPVRTHRARDWPQVRRHSARSPLHHRADALLVAAATFPTARPACGLLAAAVQQRLVIPRLLTESLDRAPRTRHRAALKLAVADIAQGSEALSEIDFARLCRRFHLPPPQQQRRHREPGGRCRYLDASWRRRDGRLVVAEVDGALHLDQRRWWDDQVRQNQIALDGALVLRFPSVVVREQPEVVAAQLRRALGI